KISCATVTLPGKVLIQQQVTSISKSRFLLRTISVPNPSEPLPTSRPAIGAVEEILLVSAMPDKGWLGVPVPSPAHARFGRSPFRRDGGPFRLAPPTLNLLGGDDRRNLRRVEADSRAGHCDFPQIKPHCPPAIKCPGEKLEAPCDFFLGQRSGAGS